MSAIEAAIVGLDGPRQLVWRHETLAAAQGTEIRCQTIVSAISPGTELAAYTGQPPLRPGNPYPRVQGYCNVARVIDAGPDAARRPGDLVLTHQSHRSHFTIPESDVLVDLPQDGDLGALSASYLFHLGYDAVLKSGVRPGSRVLVIGLGALGLTSIAMAALAGARVVAVTDQPEPARIARAYGASEIVGRGALDALDGVADVVIATTNGWADWALALRAAAVRGTIAVLGFPGRGQDMPDTNPLDSQYFYAKQLRIEAVGMAPALPDPRGFLRFNERQNLAFLAEAIASGRLDPAPILSGRWPASRIEDAYKALIARDGSPVTYLLEWNA